MRNEKMEMPKMELALMIQAAKKIAEDQQQKKWSRYTIIAPLCIIPNDKDSCAGVGLQSSKSFS